jgi:rSAM/selenodomain-associated transferase 2/rSAM/selenodomain-associated transferase 1
VSYYYEILLPKSSPALRVCSDFDRLLAIVYKRNGGGKDANSQTMKSSRKALIVFLKYPEAGKVKTRLGRDIGQQRATNLYEKLIRRTLGIASDFKLSQDDQGGVDLFLFFTPPDRKAILRKTCPGPWEFLPQAGGHLGARMRSAFRDLFCSGYEEVVLIGTDIADLMVSDIEGAFRFLRRREVVLGPAQDGGFYLIGLSLPFEKMFQFDSWSHSSIFERTLGCLVDSGLTVRTLPERRDIDRAGDLITIKDVSLFRDKISIIIPFDGRVSQLASLIDSLEAQLWPGDEVIIVRADGFHRLKTEYITPHTRLLSAPRGRGIQLDQGARLADGSLLWFLHADTVPPPNFGYHVRKVSQASDTALGCFELDYGTSRLSLQLVARLANFRTRYLGLPYGDQGLFCRKEVFEKVGGFRNHYLMEDVDFVRACKKVGKIMIIPQPLYSSPQRFLMNGIIRTSVKNHLVMFLYFLGMNNRRLYSLYYGRDRFQSQGY